MTQADQFPPARSRRRRPWLVFAPLAVFLLIAAAWSGFWFFAASASEAALTEWRNREAALGRDYRCGTQSVGGFPFRFELRCTDPQAEFAGGARPAALAAKDFVVVAQVWQPTLLIAEMIGPLAIREPGAPQTLALDWSLAQASLRGLPTSPERASLAIDQLSAASVNQGAQTMLANAGRIELHGRIASGSARDRPVLDLALSLSQASASRLGDLAAVPFDADITGVLHGLRNLAPRSWADTLRALQAANGRLDVTKARVKQGDVVATGTGMLTLSPRGALDGELKVTIANVEKLLPLLGVDRALSQLLPQGAVERLAPGLDKLLPGLGGALRGNASTGRAADMLGSRTELEGKSAVTLPLQFRDGLVSLGPFRLAEIPPLY